MNLTRLKVLVAVLDSGSITAAAGTPPRGPNTELHTTSPAIRIMFGLGTLKTMTIVVSASMTAIATATRAQGRSFSLTADSPRPGISYVDLSCLGSMAN